MKHSYLVLFLVACPVFAKENKPNGWDYNYGMYVIHDSLDLSIPEGTFVIYGTITQGYDNHPAGHALITNQAEKPSTRSDYQGEFEIQFSVSDTIVYCLNRPWGEYSLQQKFSARHRYKVRCNFEREIVLWPFARERSNCTKPVIYAYDAPCEVQLSIIPRGGFSFTFPETATGTWRFVTNADGSVRETATNKNYPYLFWEGPGKNLELITSSKAFMEKQVYGHLIKTDTCIAFFERVLPAYGLNEKETADFITWWAPQLLKREYALVQFFTNDDYAEHIAGIEVVPCPESVLRLYMYVVPLDHDDVGCEIIEPVIPSFTRTGFTVVEWGGSVLAKSPVAY